MKFKVGDRVRLIEKDNWCDGLTVGDPYTVSQTGSGIRIKEQSRLANMSAPGYWISEDCFEFISSSPHIRKVIVKVPTKEDWIAVVKQAIKDGCEKWGESGEQWDSHREKTCIRIDEDGSLHYGTKGVSYGQTDYLNYLRLTTQEYLNKFKQTSDEKPNKQRKIKMKLNIMMKKIFDKDIKTLIKADFIDGDLEFTETGKEALFAVLFELNKEALVVLAQEKIQEEEKERGRR